MWRDVLSVLKSGMPRLKWVSLRRIGYVPQFEDMQNGGAEVPDDQPWALSDSEDTDDEDNILGGDHNEPLNRTNGDHTTSNGHAMASSSAELDEDDDMSLGEDSESAGDTDEDHEPESHATDFPNLDSPTAHDFPPDVHPPGDDILFAGEELEDDGISVSHVKRKSWERWVINRPMLYGR